MTAARDALVEYLRDQLIGPGSPDEILSDLPTSRYAVAGLFPRETGAEASMQGEELDETGGGATDGSTQGPPDDPVSLSSQWMPASVGVSFLLRADELDIELWAARYELLAESKSWRRISLAAPELPETQHFDAPSRREVSRRPVLDGRAELVVVWRPVDAGRLVTVSLVNAAPPDPGSHATRTEQALFQVGLRCNAPDGAITDYPNPDALSPDAEDREMALMYRRHRTFAVGHGCSATWGPESPSGTEWVQTDWIPTFETPNLIPQRSDRAVLRLATLAASEDAGTLASDLTDFAGAYREWAAELRQRQDVPPTLESSRARILSRIEEAAGRIEAGIELLRTDPQVLLAFRLANEAVGQSIARGRGVARIARPRDSADPDVVVDTSAQPTWYPFQLAFQLAVLPSLADPGHPERDLVDLLWFPTGGGKTEAYLGLAATAIFLRRLTGGSPGPVVLTRYTLRLLTTQQFQRAATLICAAERIRQDRPDLGEVPIRLGLWIGGGSTPNDCAKAREKLGELLEEDRPISPFQLDRCPWCGTSLVPATSSEDGSDYGFDASQPNDFRIYCPTDACPFHTRLPIQVVDEVLYRSPPEFVVATVDKFAQLAFREDAGVLLGTGQGAGPSLVIQDELHLLSGPLGTMVGLYEAAIQEVIRAAGGRPKIVASTATIRRAADQAAGLFGRAVRVFPPPGTEYGDSFFATRDEKNPGRLYAGVMSQIHTPSFSLIQTCAAILQGRNEVDELGPDETDAYGTLVAYHNSLRELGKTVTFARDDIPARMAFYATAPDRRRVMDADHVVELTSNVSDSELVRTLARLEKTPEDPAGVSFVACTNMLSVGVDVPRLGVMVVNGQPKTTSEYIQATSRVGRGRVPGLVVTVYSPGKPRDRSHYEQFRSYHHSLYRWVEPTSVTPFALPSRNRALHAALVILVRHVLGLGSEPSAATFRRDLPGLDDVVEGLVSVVRRVDPDEEESTREDLDRLVDEWHDRASASGGRLRYRVNSKSFDDLLRNFGAPGLGWPTPNSMRNVDQECLVKVQGAS